MNLYWLANMVEAGAMAYSWSSEAVQEDSASGQAGYPLGPDSSDLRLSRLLDVTFDAL